MNYSTSFLDLCSCALGGLLLLMFLLIPQTKSKSLDAGGVKPTLMIECRYPVYNIDVADKSYKQAGKFPFTVEAIKKVSIKLSNGQTYVFPTENGSTLWDRNSNPNPEPVYFKGDDGGACTLTFNYKKPEGVETFGNGFISVYATIDLPEDIETLDAIMIVSSKNKKTYSQKKIIKENKQQSSVNNSQNNGIVWFSRMRDNNDDKLVIYETDQKFNPNFLITDGNGMNSIRNYNFYSTFFVFSEETKNELKTRPHKPYFGLNMGSNGNKLNFLLPEKKYIDIIKDNNLKAFYEEERCKSPSQLGEKTFSYVRLKRNNNDVIEILQEDCNYFMPVTKDDF